MLLFPLDTFNLQEYNNKKYLKAMMRNSKNATYFREEAVGVSF